MLDPLVHRLLAAYLAAAARCGALHHPPRLLSDLEADSLPAELLPPVALDADYLLPFHPFDFLLQPLDCSDCGADSHVATMPASAAEVAHSAGLHP